jgi:hypothetical protein
MPFSRWQICPVAARRFAVKNHKAGILFEENKRFFGVGIRNLPEFEVPIFDKNEVVVQEPDDSNTD